jgi:hypothetical protein
MKKSTYTCACCGRQLPYGKRTVVDLETGRQREQQYGRWIISTWTRQRYCWPGECGVDKRQRRRAARAQEATA